MPDIEVLTVRWIRHGEFERPLKRIQEVVESIIYQPAFTARVFASPLLDRLTGSIGQAALSKRKRLSEPFSPAVVFLATHLYDTGGHSAVLEDFVRLCPGAPTHILFTGAVRAWNKDIAKRRFGALGVEMSFAPHGALSSKLAWLIDRLTAIRPTRLFLFNHHQDVVAIAAAQPQLARETVFYHHADHHLCLGVHLAHAIHVDPHPMGFHNCRSSLGIENNLYCPITVPDQGARPAARDFGARDGLLSCTVANRNKIEIEYPYPYWEILPEFLRLTRGRHLHIGRLSNSIVSKIRLGLRERGLPADRFEMVTGVRNVWAELLNRRVDIYLCSFPYGGVRAGIEVMGAGVPLIAHQHYRSTFLGAGDATYPGHLRWRTPTDLWNLPAQLTPRLLAEHAALARRQYENHHREEVLRQFLSHPDMTQCSLDVPPVEFYAPDLLLAALTDARSMRRPKYKPILLRIGRQLERLAAPFI